MYCEAERSQVNITLLAGDWDPRGFQLLNQCSAWGEGQSLESVLGEEA
jgi:hypothetical protein